MEPILWFLLIGAVFILMALGRSFLHSLPLSPSLLYLLVGIGIGPVGLGLLQADPIGEAKLFEQLSEVAVIISLFTAGLKLRAPLRDRIWRVPLRLAIGSMLSTIALIAVTGVVWLALPLGAAVLLGAVLAPTDPVLASEVQVKRPSDQDQLRFGLTGEAGLNDGMAFPFVMLGLGLLGLHELGDLGWRWLAIDLVWAIVAGLAVGWLLGHLVGRLVLYLRQTYHEAVGMEDFLALGLIALAYGSALLIDSYGFLAVFAAGLSLRYIELNASGAQGAAADQAKLDTFERMDDEVLATHPEQAPAYMAHAVLGFNEQLEHIAEMVMVVLLGSLLVPLLSLALPIAFWFIPLLLLVIRPLAVWLSLLGSNVPPTQLALMAWFGIRGVGSIYYLMFAITSGFVGAPAESFLALTVLTIAVSIVVHGILVTPLMARYQASRWALRQQSSHHTSYE